MIPAGFWTLFYCDKLTFLYNSKKIILQFASVECLCLWTTTYCYYNYLTVDLRVSITSPLLHCWVNLSSLCPKLYSYLTRPAVSFKLKLQGCSSRCPFCPEVSFMKTLCVVAKLIVMPDIVIQSLHFCKWYIEYI